MLYLTFFFGTPIPVFVTLALVFVTCKQKKTVKFHLHTLCRSWWPTIAYFKSAYSVCLDSMPVKCVTGGSVDMVVSHPISYESSQEGGYVWPYTMMYVLADAFLLQYQSAVGCWDEFDRAHSTHVEHA